VQQKQWHCLHFSFSNFVRPSSNQQSQHRIKALSFPPNFPFIITHKTNVRSQSAIKHVRFLHADKPAPWFRLVREPRGVVQLTGASERDPQGLHPQFSHRQLSHLPRWPPPTHLPLPLPPRLSQPPNPLLLLQPPRRLLAACSPL
jgi:hypothetical protein